MLGEEAVTQAYLQNHLPTWAHWLVGVQGKRESSVKKYIHPIKFFKMANSQFRVKIRGDKENPERTFTIPSNKQRQRTRFPFDNVGRQTTPDLGIAPPIHQKQPLVASASSQVINLKYWELWTIWSKEMDEWHRCHCKEDFMDLVNETMAKWPISKRNEWEYLSLDDFIVVQVTKVYKNACSPSTQGFVLNGQIVFREDNDEATPGIADEEEEDWRPIHPQNRHKSGTVKIEALAGLAEIFATVIVPNDLLVICGYELKFLDNQTIPVVSLNSDEEHTPILRVPGYNFNSEIKMVEHTKPTKAQNRYQFCYEVSWGFHKDKKVPRREVKQFRDFKYGDLGANVLESIAYNNKRWHFPVPVVKSTAKSIFHILENPAFSMFNQPEVRRRRNRTPEGLIPKTAPSTATSRSKNRAVEWMKNCGYFLSLILIVFCVVVLYLFIICNQDNMLCERAARPI